MRWFGSEVFIKGIPLSLCVVVFVNLTSFGMAASFAFSFLPRLVKYMGVSEINAGYWAGVIASAVYLGRFITGFGWGNLSDRFGRKIGFVLAGSILLASSLGLGFCRSIWTCVLVRLLQGMSMGHIILGKAIMSDYCDQENISFGISIVMTAADLGRILGTSLGGILVFPTSKYPSVFGQSEIFSRYVMLLPCLVLVFCSFAGLVLTCVLIPNDKTQKSIQESKRRSKGTIVEKMKHSKYFMLLKTKSVVWTCQLTMVLSFIAVGMYEVYPLLAATALKYNGMALTETRIGLLEIGSVIIAMTYQLTVFPYINKSFGTKHTFIGSCILFAFLQPLLPLTAMVKNQTVLCVLLVLVYSLLRCTTQSCYVALNVFIYNSVENQLVGSAHGLTDMFSSVGFMVGPNVYGSLFAWSLSNVRVKGNSKSLGFPFNQYFVFLLSCVITLFIAGCAYMLPNSIDAKPVEDGKNDGDKLLGDETIAEDELDNNY